MSITRIKYFNTDDAMCQTEDMNLYGQLVYGVISINDNYKYKVIIRNDVQGEPDVTAIHSKEFSCLEYSKRSLRKALQNVGIDILDEVRDNNYTL